MQRGKTLGETSETRGWGRAMSLYHTYGREILAAEIPFSRQREDLFNRTLHNSGNTYIIARNLSIFHDTSLLGRGLQLRQAFF